MLELKGVDHESVLSSAEFLNYLRGILFGKLREGEYFAKVDDDVPKEMRRTFSTKKATRQFCIQENVAKCPSGMKANRWTRKNVEIVCFNNGQQSWEMLNEIRMGKAAEENEEERVGSKWANEASKTVELREMIVPLTCV